MTQTGSTTIEPPLSELFTSLATIMAKLLALIFVDYGSNTTFDLHFNFSNNKKM